MSRAEQQAARGRRAAWQAVERELGATESEVRAALALFRAGRALVTVASIEAANAIRVYAAAVEAAEAYNTPLRSSSIAAGGGSEAPEPYERCPRLLPDVVAHAHAAASLVRRVRIARPQTERVQSFGGVEVPKVEPPARQVEVHRVEVVNGRLVARHGKRGEDGRFVPCEGSEIAARLEQAIADGERE